MWGFPLSLFVITSLSGNSPLPYQFDNLMYYFTQTRSSSDVAFLNPPPAWLAEYFLAKRVDFALSFAVDLWLVFFEQKHSRRSCNERCLCLQSKSAIRWFYPICRWNDSLLVHANHNSNGAYSLPCVL